ncbi:MAG: hypothetical protein A3K22_04965 [Deltaproteobacteria bacterium RBG_16_42_7]|nr:MAG: hypothetical protein A3K22_04965 [Deltaproteobacteria bacterium RBG_16_42_7]
MSERVTFSLDQQVRVDKLMDDAFGKGYLKGVREGNKEINRLKIRVLELESKKSILNFWRR